MPIPAPLILRLADPSLTYTVPLTAKSAPAGAVIVVSASVTDKLTFNTPFLKTTLSPGEVAISIKISSFTAEMECPCISIVKAVYISTPACNTALLSSLIVTASPNAASNASSRVSYSSSPILATGLSAANIACGNSETSIITDNRILISLFGFVIVCFSSYNIFKFIYNNTTI